ALDAPAAAARLHRRLLALVDAEVALAREVDELAHFLPALDTAVAPVPPAQRRLNVALRGARTRGAQADALESYADALAGPLGALRTLTSPPVTAPVLAGEVRTLTQVSATARQLAAALRRGKIARLPALQRAFLLASRSSDTVTAQ